MLALDWRNVDTALLWELDVPSELKVPHHYYVSDSPDIFPLASNADYVDSRHMCYTLATSIPI